ncbi:MAG TPA: hypothetical protein VGJ18_26005 [Gemmatimonadaceae bacterium]|jgi:hypothetical protein
MSEEPFTIVQPRLADAAEVICGECFVAHAKAHPGEDYRPHIPPEQLVELHRHGLL